MSREVERFYQDLGSWAMAWMTFQPCFGGGDEGAEICKVGGAIEASEAARDFLLDLHHTHVALAWLLVKGTAGLVRKRINSGL